MRDSPFFDLKKVLFLPYLPSRLGSAYFTNHPTYAPNFLIIVFVTFWRKLDKSTIFSSQIVIFLKISQNFLKMKNLNACSTVSVMFG